MVFRPNWVIHRITELTPEFLHEEEIKGILVDVDNTCTPYHVKEIPEDILHWLYGLIEMGITFAPYSNALPHRIAYFCEKFDLPNPGMALKPLNIGFRKSMRILRVPKKNTILVGDQIFTDVMAGKFAGIRTAIVDPVSGLEFPATKVMRHIERFVGRHGWKYDNLTEK